jgi:carnosine N-methyltransferase
VDLYIALSHSQGRAERDVCYKPMIDELLKRYPSQAERARRRILIPGAGLARLGWEIAFLGESNTETGE